MSAKGREQGPRVLEAVFAGAHGIGETSQMLAPTYVEVAFAGRSNVGKSSLINCLVERRGLVRTSSTPGCTRQINFFEVRTDDETVLRFVDLPGYGFAKRSKEERRAWGDLIEGYLAERPTLRAVVLLVDLRRGLEEDDRALVDFIQASTQRADRPPVRVLLVATKTDKVRASQRKAVLDKLSKEIGQPIIGFSSPTAEGRGRLWNAIRRAAGVAPPVAEMPVEGS